MARASWSRRDRGASWGEGSGLARRWASWGGKAGWLPLLPMVAAAALLALAVTGPAEQRGAGSGASQIRVAEPARSTPAEIVVAVAANFGEVHEALAARFRAKTGHVVTTTLGSTGQLYAQIRNGAPFDVFLSADGERPRLLESSGHAVSGTRFTYARGRLVLYGAKRTSVRPNGEDLRERDYRHLAIASARTAPYGAAAEQALRALGLMEHVESRIVRGENIAQAHQFVKSGAAEWGLVALAQVRAEPPGTYWTVPERLHEPIVQDAVLLSRAASSEAARAYLSFLRSQAARAIIESFGYGTR